MVGRLAPSPTGGLHLGHARTFLIAWWMARSVGGRVLMRIEDLDTERVRLGMAEQAEEDLRWLGLDWDRWPDGAVGAGRVVQSGRLELYRAALESLKERELVYPCTCTRADIARAASAPHAGEEGPVYPGTCAHRGVADAKGLGRPFAWRFRVPEGVVSWFDLFRGPVSVEPRAQGGDFVVGRSSGVPSYQLAAAVDDALMGITQVIRGDDLIPSTPRQILLLRALEAWGGGEWRAGETGERGWKIPSYGHVPLAYEPDGRRLAKRDGSWRLASMRAEGVVAGAVVACVCRSCGLSPFRHPADALAEFDPTLIPGRPWVVPANVREELARGRA